MTESNPLLPTYFISHGGGPWPWIKDQMGGDWTALESSLRSIPLELESYPRAILVISGHWEASEFTVQTSANPPMLYDYGGFPEFTYHLQYRAPGSPDVAERVLDLLRGEGIAARTDERRGFDHGVFAPLYVMYPDAEVPILQLSIKHGYDPSEHLALGRALTPLRSEGVLILGSGFTYHNLSMMGPGAAAPSTAFENWLTHALTRVPHEERDLLLEVWRNAPGARMSHPAADHLIPLMVAVGAAANEDGHRIYFEDDFMGSITSASYRFGDAPAARSLAEGEGFALERPRTI